MISLLFWLIVAVYLWYAVSWVYRDYIKPWREHRRLERNAIEWETIP